MTYIERIEKYVEINAEFDMAVLSENKSHSQFRSYSFTLLLNKKITGISQ